MKTLSSSKLFYDNYLAYQLNKQLDNIINQSNIFNENFENNYENLDYEIEKKNLMKGMLYIKLNEINNNIILFNSDRNYLMDVYVNDNNINLKKYNNNWIIEYNFEKEGIYNFEIIFYDEIIELANFFEDCTNIISLDLSELDTSNVTSMEKMFNGCNKLKEIKGLEKFNTNKVKYMNFMFSQCNNLENLNLSNFDTSNVLNMSQMFKN